MSLYQSSIKIGNEEVQYWTCALYNHVQQLLLCVEDSSYLRRTLGFLISEKDTVVVFSYCFQYSERNPCYLWTWIFHLFYIYIKCISYDAPNFEEEYYTCTKWLTTLVMLYWFASIIKINLMLYWFASIIEINLMLLYK